MQTVAAEENNFLEKFVVYSKKTIFASDENNKGIFWFLFLLFLFYKETGGAVLKLTKNN